MNTAINWFEIAVTDLDRAQRFYESILGCTMQREAMGPNAMAVFPYTRGEGVSGALMPVTESPHPGCGTLVYLNAGVSLDAVLARVVSAGGALAQPRQALPPGMGFFAHITDPDGNRVGLHALD
ncbi:glyoxalase [Hydrogenophaga crassostreae]|uniref:Glyoxalase n=1 Tax=Hydrogenophaga crassostreae TaxID=1763535 RepID=A0A167GQJ5_9BURK|nr:VOC family protein [Hydrogenophaga crassostreae]AOW11670.1 glyoxalase [Hydrogenophaga crassostreae]OAD39762.1 glyoxalase [Hydrogenophaga crassostreae]